MLRILTLTPEQLRTPSLLSLLRDAAGQEDAELRRLIAEVLPGMSVIGLSDSVNVTAFAAFEVKDERVVLEYIAVDAAARGGGVGRALVQYIRREHAASKLVAETDDDAFRFYRRLGFKVEAAPTDPRWPDRRRYRCTLPPLNAEQPTPR